MYLCLKYLRSATVRFFPANIQNTALFVVMHPWPVFGLIRQIPWFSLSNIRQLQYCFVSIIHFPDMIHPLLSRYRHLYFAYSLPAVLHKLIEQQPCVTIKVGALQDLVIHLWVYNTVYYCVYFSCVHRGIIKAEGKFRLTSSPFSHSPTAELTTQNAWRQIEPLCRPQG